MPFYINSTFPIPNFPFVHIVDGISAGVCFVLILNNIFCCIFACSVVDMHLTLGPGVVFRPPDLHDALFVVGSLDETLELRGLRYHPIDIETSVSRAHRSIAERSACYPPHPPHQYLH